MLMMISFRSTYLGHLWAIRCLPDACAIKYSRRLLCQNRIGKNVKEITAADAEGNAHESLQHFAVITGFMQMASDNELWKFGKSHMTGPSLRA